MLLSPHLCTIFFFFLLCFHCLAGNQINFNFLHCSQPMSMLNFCMCNPISLEKNNFFQICGFICRVLLHGATAPNPERVFPCSLSKRGKGNQLCDLLFIVVCIVDNFDYHMKTKISIFLDLPLQFIKHH